MPLTLTVVLTVLVVLALVGGLGYLIDQDAERHEVEKEPGRNEQVTKRAKTRRGASNGDPPGDVANRTSSVRLVAARGDGAGTDAARKRGDSDIVRAMVPALCGAFRVSPRAGPAADIQHTLQKWSDSESAKIRTKQIVRHWGRHWPSFSEVSDPIFHIALRREWAAATSAYRPDAFEEDGCIHCSTASQVMRVARTRFADAGTSFCSASIPMRWSRTCGSRIRGRRRGFPAHLWRARPRGRHRGRGAHRGRRRGVRDADPVLPARSTSPGELSH